jgi:hypothetical protein
VRRFFFFIAIVLIPGLAVAPAFAHSVEHSALSGAMKAHKCPKGKKYDSKHHKCVKAGKHKPTPTRTPTKKVKKKPTPTRTPKPRQAPTIAPTPTDTFTPTPTNTPTSTPTPTPTPTNTPTPTATPTPTPLPLSATFQLAVDVAPGYRVGLFLCGLPTGGSATFTPNPGAGSPDSFAVAGGSFTTQLTVQAPYTTFENTYAMALHYYAQDPTGASIANPPGGVSLLPPTVLLDVGVGGKTTLSGSDVPVAVGATNCSPVPSGFGPAPTATPVLTGINPSATISEDHPSFGDNVTVDASLSENGKLVPNVQVHTTWLFPFGPQVCNALSDSSGHALCSVQVNQSSPGYVVQVRVDMTFAGVVYTTYTHFTL